MSYTITDSRRGGIETTLAEILTEYPDAVAYADPFAEDVPLDAEDDSYIVEALSAPMFAKDMRILVWADEDASRNDDGSRAVAVIRRRS